jgi:hypothetical protein
MAPHLSSLFLIFCSFICIPGVAQVKLKGDRILANDTVYCYYREGESVPSDMQHHTSLSVPSGDFKDRYFTAKADSFLALSMEAKILAHPRLAYLTYYYSIRFFTTGEEFNISYAPLRAEAFIKDLVKYGVFHQGYYQEDAARKLMKRWKTKVGVIEDKIVSEGVSKSYIRTGEQPTSDSLVQDIVISKGKIYSGDSIIATYKKGPPYDPARSNTAVKSSLITYYVRDLSGKDVMVITVPALRSETFLLLLPEMEELKMITPDKSEEKLLRAAAGVLRLRKEI